MGCRMKQVLLVAFAAMALAWMSLASAGSSAEDVSSTLEDNHVDIRSVLDPYIEISRSQPVAVALPDKASIVDKQLVELFKVNLAAQGFTVTSSDKAKWILTPIVNDQSTLLSYSDRGFFSISYTAEAAPIDYAILTVAIAPADNPGVAAWTSVVRAYTDFWVRHQEVVVAAILATYGQNFYERDTRPVGIPDDVQNNSSQPPTLEQIKACLASPKDKGCTDILRQ